MGETSEQIKPVDESGVINLQRLDSFPSHAPKDFKELEISELKIFTTSGSFDEDIIPAGKVYSQY